MKNGVCPKCNSHDIIPDLPASSSPLSKSIGVHTPGEPIGFTDTLRVWICGACGYTEFYTRNPEQLLRAYQSARE